MNDELAEEQDRNQKEQQILRDRIEELEKKLDKKELIISNVAERYEFQGCAECESLISHEWLCYDHEKCDACCGLHQCNVDRYGPDHGIPE
tara:strand:- start:46 stop:318 length:273 start_codon:yes stop_codon:yes gene_type:complete